MVKIFFSNWDSIAWCLPLKWSKWEVPVLHPVKSPRGGLDTTHNREASYSLPVYPHPAAIIRSHGSWILARRWCGPAGPAAVVWKTGILIVISIHPRAAHMGMVQSLDTAMTSGSGK